VRAPNSFRLWRRSWRNGARLSPLLFWLGLWLASLGSASAQEPSAANESGKGQEARKQTSQQPATRGMRPTTDFAADNLDHVAATVDQLLEFLKRDAGLMVEFKRLLPALPPLNASGRRRRSLSDQQSSRRRRLGRAGGAETRALDGRASRETQCATADRCGRRIRFPYGKNRASASVDARQRIGMAFPFIARAASAMAALPYLRHPICRACLAGILGPQEILVVLAACRRIPEVVKLQFSCLLKPVDHAKITRLVRKLRIRTNSSSALSSRGLGHRPLTAVTRVRIPLALPISSCSTHSLRSFGIRRIPQVKSAAS
jgi:hypothetical protein